METNRARKTVLIVVAVLFAAAIVHAQVTWTKDSRNPVLFGGGDTAWDAHVFTPMVLYNSDSGRYEMWYGGSDLAWKLPYRFGFAISKDGINWTKYGSPVMFPDSGTWEEARLQFPAVIRENGKYKMWYGGLRGYKGGIGYATSPDGVQWTKHPGNPVLGPGTATWEADGPFVCAVVSVAGGGFKMWYAGFEAYPSVTSRIGIATSGDGLNWRRDTVNNPVLSIGTPGQWDDTYVMEPTTLQIDKTSYMFYTGVQGSVRSIGMASSSDGGTKWTKHASNPLLAPSATGWDNRYVEAGTVVRREDTLVMWYTGSTTLTSSKHWRIGRATSRIVASGIAEGGQRVPNAFTLRQNFPNPFNPRTVISYQLPVASKVKVAVYDLLGREVATVVNENRPAGVHSVQFDAGGLASGVYLYRMSTGDFVDTKRLLLLR